jgi:hypothetical protein
MPERPVPLSELERDLPEPVDGWAAELGRRGVVIVEDDLGRAAVTRSVARSLFAEHREQEEAAARHREEHERRLVAAAEAHLAAVPRGIPVSAEVPGLTAAQLMMAADPMAQSARRESPLEHALQNTGLPVYHPLNEGAS